jgi:enamine deaminase RidA (YjgF/YER057c/UK114 family)
VTAEGRVAELGLEIPDFTITPYTGLKYGAVRSHRLVGDVLYLSGHLPELTDGTVVHPGTVGESVTVEEGYAAARVAGINALAGIRLAVGSLDCVEAVISSLNFVVCRPSFPDIHLVASGCTDLLRDVFGAEAGVGGRTTVGIAALARGHCFETLLTLQVACGEPGGRQTA